MKKTPRKLKLETETVGALEGTQLEDVTGGGGGRRAVEGPLVDLHPVGVGQLARSYGCVR